MYPPKDPPLAVTWTQPLESDYFDPGLGTKYPVTYRQKTALFKYIPHGTCPMASIAAWRWLVQELLESDQVLSWDEAFGWVGEEDEYNLEVAIDELKAEGRIEVSLKDGGYRLLDEPEAKG